MDKLFDDFAWACRTQVPSIIPIIDLKLLQQEERNQTPVVAGTQRYLFQQTLFNVGFFYLEGHDITENMLRLHYDTTREFLAWPLAEKCAFQIEKTVRGYTPFAKESTAKATNNGEYPDLCEKYTWTMDEKNLAPTEAFFTIWTEYCALQTQLARELLTIIRSILPFATKQQQLLFDEAIQGQGMLRYLHYPYTEPSHAPLAMAPHHDIGLITLSYQVPSPSGFAPLQVEINGTFISIPPIRNTFVVNVGEVLRYLSHNRIKSATHHVLSPPLTSANANHERTAMVFFFDPNPKSEFPDVVKSDWGNYDSENDTKVFKNFRDYIEKKM